MTTLQEAEQLLSVMTRAEKAQLLQWVVCDLGEAFPGEDVKRAVDRSVARAGPSGLFFCTSNTIGPEVPLENLRAMYTARVSVLGICPGDNPTRSPGPCAPLREAAHKGRTTPNHKTQTPAVYEHARRERGDGSA